jgi:hypothetical protein
MSHTLSPRRGDRRRSLLRGGGRSTPARHRRDTLTPVVSTRTARRCALIAVHVVAKPSFSTTNVDTRPPLLPMTPVPRSLLTTRPPTRATLWRFKTTLTSRFAKTRSLWVCGVAGVDCRLLRTHGGAYGRADRRAYPGAHFGSPTREIAPRRHRRASAPSTRSTRKAGYRTRTPCAAPELPPCQTGLLAHAEAQMVQAVADPTTATKGHARALLLR